MSNATWPVEPLDPQVGPEVQGVQENRSEGRLLASQQARIILKPQDVVLVFLEGADSDRIHELWLEMFELGLQAVVYDPDEEPDMHCEDCGADVANRPHFLGCRLTGNTVQAP